MAKKTSKKKSKKKKKTGSAGNPPPTPPQIPSYIVQVGNAIRGLSEAEERLIERRDMGLASPAERAGIRFDLGRIDARQAEVQGDILAYIHENSSVKQPTKADITKAKNIADILEQTAADATTASAVMGLVAKLITVYRKTQK